MLEPASRLGPSRVAWATLGYLVCVAVATYPVIRTFGSRIPGELTDPLEHLWILRWSRACLLTGVSPFFASGLQAPIGVPLGYFPTMHLPTFLYLVLRLFTSNDVACFNLIWTFGLVSTGVSTFVLAWWVSRNSAAAWLAGLGAMLSGPMMMHAHGHLETMQMGAVPLFLIAWLKFVDRPGWRALGASIGLYWLVVASAPYFAVLAIFPAVWFVTWSIARVSGTARWSWFRYRLGWLSAFAIVVVPGLVVLFASQVWAVGHGYAMTRSRAEFDMLGAPVWSNLVPSPRHALGRFLVPDSYQAVGSAKRMSECSSYLGLVTLGLLVYSGLRRVKFARAGYWWSVLALMVVLSMGAETSVGSIRISLPAGWLHGVFPPFQLIRVPARFNLFAVVCAAVVASSGLADLLGRIGSRWRRLVLMSALGGLVMADLAMVPFPAAMIPPMPGIYREIARANPSASIVDVPMFGAKGGQVFLSLWGYWQSIHGLKTSSGYPGLTNTTFETEVVPMSPWWSSRLADPAYLAGPTLERFGPVAGVDPRDYAWLYLKAHHYDQVVIHQGFWTDPRFASGTERIKLLMAGSRTYEDADVAVYSLDRMPRPDHLTWLCARGWRAARDRSAGFGFGVLKLAKLVVFVPETAGDLKLNLDQASAFAHPRVIRLVGQGRELARWSVEPGTPRNLESPAIRLEPGIHELTLEADGEARPTRIADRLDDLQTAYAWKVDAVRVRSMDSK